MSEPRSLQIEFSSEDTFRSEYTTNLANGGIFVATEQSFALREAVSVVLDLLYCDRKLVLEGEVVHCVPPELAQTGATPGVAVQFHERPSDLRAQLEPIAGPVDSGNERALGGGRRAASRSPARVRVRLTTADQEEIEGRTRNISTSGMLVSVREAQVPIGQPVRLTIVHPISGEEFEVGGTVVRQVADEACGVTALGIEFHMREVQRAQIADFVADVRAAEHSRRLGGITGPISALGLAALLRMFGSSAPRGTLTVTSGAVEGYVTFENGLLRGAQVGGYTGVEALAQMLGWQEGSFDFHTRIEVDEFGAAPLPLEGAIEEAVRCDKTRVAEGGAAAPAYPEPLLPPEPEERPAPLEDPVDLMGLDLDDSLRIDLAEEPEKPAQGADLDLDAVDADDDVEIEIELEAGVAVEIEAESGVETGADFDPDLSLDDEPLIELDAEVGEEEQESGSAASEEAAQTDSELDAITLDDLLASEETEGEEAEDGLEPDSVRSEHLSPETRLTADLAAVGPVRSELGKIEEAVLDLAAVGMSIAKVIDVIPEPADQIHRVLDELMARGLVKAAD